jgi:hypothetical protein
MQTLHSAALEVLSSVVLPQHIVSIFGVRQLAVL